MKALQTTGIAKLAIIRRAAVVAASTAVLVAAMGVSPSHAQNIWTQPASTTITTGLR